MTQYHEHHHHHHHYHNYQQSIHVSSLKVSDKITGKALDTGKAMCTIQIDNKSGDQINTITIPPPVKALDGTGKAMHTAKAKCKLEDDTEELPEKEAVICVCTLIVFLLMFIGGLLYVLIHFGFDR
ncbi:uncharacterized protein LOC144546231 [Carex rostrata]